MYFGKGARSAARCLAIGVAAAVIFPIGQAASAETKAGPAVSKSASADAEIRATAVTFVQAFNRGDAPAVAALWTPDGTAADDTGTIFKGRKAIEGQYAQLFKEHPDARMEVAVESVEFPTPAMAIEDGVARVESQSGGPPQLSHYTAVHIKQDGKWLMAAVRESSTELPSNYARVEGLGWLVGTWTAERDGTTVHTTIRWIANKSFLEREYTVRKDGIATSSGRQIIGWDPKAGQIRSWCFDAAGGNGTGIWTATPDGWRIESTGVLPDGTPTSSRDLVIRVPGEDDVLGWRSVARTAGGAPLPDTPEVVLDRVVNKK